MKFRPIFLLVLFVALFAACQGAKFPDVKSKAAARQVTVSMSYGVDTVVQSCVGIMQIMAEEDEAKAKAFGRTCYTVVKPMAKLLVEAAEAVDNWDKQSGALAKVACTAKYFAGTFWPDSKALIGHYTEPPKELDEIMAFVSVVAGLAGQCAE